MGRPFCIDRGRLARVNPVFTPFLNPNGMRSLICLILLCACDTPGPDFRGADATRVTVAGTTFDIRIKDRKAEAIRLNRESKPRWMIIGAKAGFAIQQVSGCEITKMAGDTAVVTAKLSCDGDSRPWAAPESLRYECDIDESYFNRDHSIETTEMSCNLVDA